MRFRINKWGKTEQFSLLLVCGTTKATTDIWVVNDLNVLGVLVLMIIQEDFVDIEVLSTYMCQGTISEGLGENI